MIMLNPVELLTLIVEILPSSPILWLCRSYLITRAGLSFRIKGYMMLHFLVEKPRGVRWMDIIASESPFTFAKVR
jgi:hypothetical protein